MKFSFDEYGSILAVLIFAIPIVRMLLWLVGVLANW